MEGEFRGDLHFCHGSCISCRVLIALYGSQDITVTKSCPTKREEYLFQIYGLMTLIFLLIIMLSLKRNRSVFLKRLEIYLVVEKKGS